MSRLPFSGPIEPVSPETMSRALLAITSHEIAAPISFETKEIFMRLPPIEEWEILCTQLTRERGATKKRQLIERIDQIFNENEDKERLHAEHTRAMGVRSKNSNGA